MLFSTVFFNQFFEVLGLVLGGFGKGFGGSGRLLGDFGASFLDALIQDGLQEAFWIDFESIWGGFWEGLGGAWEGLGRDLRGFGSLFAGLGADLGLLLRILFVSTSYRTVYATQLAALRFWVPSGLQSASAGCANA